jgi:hypothetical protein
MSPLIVERHSYPMRQEELSVETRSHEHDQSVASTRDNWQVMCSDAVKSAHPLFEAAVVGIHVLHVVDLADNPDTCSQIN